MTVNDLMNYLALVPSESKVVMRTEIDTPFGSEWITTDIDAIIVTPDAVAISEAMPEMDRDGE